MISRSDSRGLVVRLGSAVLASGMTRRNSDTGLAEPLITSGKRHGASNLTVPGGGALGSAWKGRVEHVSTREEQLLRGQKDILELLHSMSSTHSLSLFYTFTIAFFAARLW